MVNASSRPIGQSDHQSGLFKAYSKRDVRELKAYSKSRLQPVSKPGDENAVHQSQNRKRTFVAQAISKIPELSHNIQDRRPRHSKHPSLLAMLVVFPVLFNNISGPVPRTYSSP